MSNENKNIIDAEVKEEKMGNMSERLEVITELNDPKLIKKVQKTIERHKKWEEFKALPLKEKAKKVAKPVGIGLGVAAAVTGGVILAVSKLGSGDEVIEGECSIEDLGNEPWNYAEMEGLNSEPVVDATTVE